MKQNDDGDEKKKWDETIEREIRTLVGPAGYYGGPLDGKRPIECTGDERIVDVNGQTAVHRFKERDR